MEGNICRFSFVDCTSIGLTLPVTTYDHQKDCAVVGGYVYRGQNVPSLNGVYLFGDYCTGTIWGLKRSTDGFWQSATLLESGLSISSFGQDSGGELYVLDVVGGGVYEITTP